MVDIFNWNTHTHVHEFGAVCFAWHCSNNLFSTGGLNISSGSSSIPPNFAFRRRAFNDPICILISFASAAVSLLFVASSFLGWRICNESFYANVCRLLFRFVFVPFHHFKKTIANKQVWEKLLYFLCGTIYEIKVLPSENNTIDECVWKYMCIAKGKHCRWWWKPICVSCMYASHTIHCVFVCVKSFMFLILFSFSRQMLLPSCPGWDD